MSTGKVIARVGLKTEDGLLLMDKQFERLHVVQSQPLHSVAMKLLNVASQLSFRESSMYNLNLGRLKSVLSSDTFTMTACSPSLTAIDLDLFNDEVLEAENKEFNVRVGTLNVLTKNGNVPLNVPVVSVTENRADNTILQLHIMYVSQPTSNSGYAALFTQSYIKWGTSRVLNVKRMLQKHMPIYPVIVKDGSSHYDTRGVVRKHHRKLMRNLCQCMGGEQTEIHLTRHTIQCSTTIPLKSDSVDACEQCQFNTLYLKL